MSGKSYRGQILISNASVVMDDFNKSVVFMIEHESTGAFGLVINKKSRYLMNDVVMGLPTEIGNEYMFWGGPVDHSFICILHNNPNVVDAGQEVIPGVFLSRSFETLVKLLQGGNSSYHVFHGYSGWGAGQLESEFQRKSWVAHTADSSILFHKDPENAWRDALKSKGGIYKYFAEHTKDPILN